VRGAGGPDFCIETEAANDGQARLLYAIERSNLIPYLLHELRVA